MRILVCGGRDYNNKDVVFKTLDEYMAEDIWLGCGTAIIAGGASGADSLAIEWAVERGIDFEEYYPDWTTHGKAAGPIRNQRMLDEGDPDCVVAFPGGKGTADMVNRAKKAGIDVLEVKD